MKSNTSSPLMAAVKENQLDNVRALIKNGSDVNECDSHGRTPLFHACRAPERFALVPVLINAGADRNIQDDDGWTALMVTCREVDPRRKNTNDPAYRAITQNRFRQMRFLVESCTDVDLVNSRGQTAYDIAKSEKKFATVSYLKENYSSLK